MNYKPVDKSKNKKIDPEFSRGGKIFSKKDIAEIQKAVIAEANKPKGSQPNHAVTDSQNHTKPLSKSEKDFLAGQKYKEKVVKKTGVYPNTAN